MKSRAAIIVILLLVVAGLVVWQLRTVTHFAQATSSREFELQCDFDKFRQIMVRKNATHAIVNHGSMELLGEHIHNVSIDTSKDDRPILNALLGKSKTEVDATKTLTVRLSDAGVRADQLQLRQKVNIDNDKIAVKTVSIAPQQDVQEYATTLKAAASGDDATKIRLSIDMEIEVQVPKLFRSTADNEVRKAAEAALANQQDAIIQLVLKHVDECFIVPELPST